MASRMAGDARPPGKLPRAMASKMAEDTVPLTMLCGLVQQETLDKVQVTQQNHWSLSSFSASGISSLNSRT